MTFPTTRMRRLRQSKPLRSLVRETRLDVSQLVQPLFVCPGTDVRRPIDSMPGCAQLSVDQIALECRELYDLGIESVILFGIPARKDALGESALDAHGVVPEAIRAIKEAVPGLLVWCDVCLCEYTSHGHCGVLEGERVDNDRTIERLAQMSLTCARAGADVVAPSDMMDGRVSVIREALDDEGFEDTVIVSYAAKYASGFYGPFREAAECAPQFGDRQSYQMDPANTNEALREVELDLEEGADMVMVKPALAYLDVIQRIKQEFLAPVVAYNVSGEFAMVKAAGAAGWIDPMVVAREILLSIRRAGADIILTYHAKEVAQAMRETKR